MKASKKNGFFTFLLSLIPGAAQMYMGFMKLGFSMLGLFFVTIFIADVLNLGSLALVCIAVWVYNFFQANNLASLNDEDFAKVEDKFIFGADSFIKTKMTAERHRKYIGIGLIVFGIILMWNITMNMFIPWIVRYFSFPWDIFWRIRDLVPQLVISFIVIFVGIKTLKGKNKSLPEDEGDE